MLRSLRPLSAVAAIALTAACTPFDGFDTGAAQVEIQRGDEAPLELLHDPTVSQLTLTPPAGGVVELNFAYQDPFVQLTLRVDATQLAAGEIVSLPTDENALFLSIDLNDAEFISTAPAASGAVELGVLNVDEEAGFAELNATFDVTLPASDPMSDETVHARGFVEGSVGQPAGADDGTPGASVNVDAG